MNKGREEPTNKNKQFQSKICLYSTVPSIEDVGGTLIMAALHPDGKTIRYHPIIINY